MEKENENKGLENAIDVTDTAISDNDKEFDASSFLGSESSLTSEDSEKNNNGLKDKAIEKTDTDDDSDTYSMEWDISDEDDDAGDNEKIISEKATTELENSAVTDSVDYETLSNEIGIEIKSKDDLITKFKEITEQLNEAKAQSVGTVTNDKIKAWQSYAELSDEALLKADFKANGFSDDELEEAIDVYRDNGSMRIEATKIRKNLNRWIADEKQNSVKAQENEAQQQKANQEAMRKKIRETLDGTETMFGFKMSKDEAELPKVRDTHYKYITDKFLGDITKDEKSIVEASWLWRNKDSIINALKNSGKQSGKKEILDNLQNPDLGNSNRIPGINDKGFNAKSFVESN